MQKPIIDNIDIVIVRYLLTEEAVHPPRRSASSGIKQRRFIMNPSTIPSNKEMQLFNFESHQVRTIIIDGEIWFLAKDIAQILDFRSANDMTRLLDDDEKGAHNMRTPGGDQEMTIINESGLYSCILRSRKPQAKTFKRWVTHEVLPSIRKTGSYSLQKQLNKETVLEAYDVFGFSFQVTKQIHHNHNQAVLSANIATKKVTGTDVLELTDSTHLISTVQEQLLIPTEIGIRLGLSAHKVNSLLEEKGLLIRYRDDKSKIKKGTDELSEEGKRYGVYLDTNKKHSDGTPVRQIKWHSDVIGVLKLKAA